MTPMPESSAADRDTIRSPAFVLRRYVLAIALFAAAFAATVAFREFLRPQIFYFFVLAVALSAWLSGLGPALFVGVLSVLAADFLFIEPVGHIGSDAPRGLISLALFLVLAGIISSITARMRAALRQAKSEATREQVASRELKVVLEHLPVGIWVVDPEGTLVYANPEARRIWGGAILGGPESYGKYRAWWLETGAPVRIEEWALTRALRDHKATVDEELEIEAFDGERRIILNAAVPIMGAGDEFLGAVVVNEDITARKRAEQSFREVTERLDAIIRASPLAIIAMDANSRVQAWNPAAERMFGWREEELLGKPTPIVPEDRASEVEREFDLALQGEVFTGLETEWLRKDGSRIDVSVSTAPVRNAEGKLLGVMVLIDDSTERKRREESQRFLAEAGRILASSLDYEESLPEIARLVVTRGIADGCFITVLEDGVARRLAITHADPDREAALVELSRRWPIEPSESPAERRVLETARPELAREITDEELQRLAADERHLNMLRGLGMSSLIAVPMVARGRTLGIIVLTMDVSGRHFDDDDLAVAEELAVRVAFSFDNARLFAEANEARAEAERRAREEQSVRLELERVMESRARLVRGFSHDVKNPLGAADGFLELLELGVKGDLSPEQREGVSRSRRSIRTALNLIEDLIDLARAEAGQIEVDRRPVDIAELVRETADENRAAAEAKGLAVSVDLDGDMPTIETDAARVRQILGNLLSNATKYTDHGRISIRASVRSDGGAPGPGRWVAVDVEDTGAGIPKDQQAFVFEEFARIEPTEKAGAGIGLAISRRMARAIGGDVTLESDVGKGSTFTLWLPVDAAGDGRRDVKQSA